jgi:hypothetical protein
MNKSISTQSLSASEKSILLVIIFSGFILLFAFSAFRNNLGTDYHNYRNLYLNLQKNTLDIEWLFRLFFIDFLRKISENPITFFIVSSFFINYFFIIMSIRRYSSNIPLSIIIYFSFFYFDSYNYVRQFIAIALFLFYIPKLIQSKKYFLSILFLLILTQLHTSIVVYIPFVLLRNKQLKIKNYLIFWGLSLIVWHMQVMKIIGIEQVTSVFSTFGFLGSKFKLWSVGIAYFWRENMTNFQLYLRNLLFLIFLFNKSKSRIYSFWLNLYLYGLALQNIFVSINQMSQRIGLYGNVALLFLVPLYINEKKGYNKIGYTVFFSILFLSWGYYSYVILGLSGVFLPN